MKNKIKIKEPLYFKEFKCIGGECENSCCIDWDIDIDKSTFKQYFKVKNEEMKTMFQKNLYNNKECTSFDIDYGKVKLNDKKRCPFLDDNNYCVIYSNLGEEYLSNVCTHFPRVMNIIDNNYEISLDVACPEAARIILSKKEGIEFTEDEEVFKKYIVSGEINTEDKNIEYLPLKYFKEIRDTSIKILKNRKYTLSERLYVLGDFICNLEEEAEYEEDNILEFIEGYNIEDICRDYTRNNMNYILQVSFFNDIIQSLNIYEEIDNELFKQATKQVIEGFSINDKEEFSKNYQMYIDIFEKYDEDFIKDNSYILENYLVNFIYNNLFPFSESQYMFDGYIMILVRYAFIRYYLSGKYFVNKTDSSDEMIRFIHLFSKAMEHDKDYMIRLLDYIKEHDFDNMEFAQTIL